MPSMTVVVLLVSALFIVVTPSTVEAHGYMKSPRSRNLLAYQERNWEDGEGDSPLPEDCPHCLNRGGTRAQCGLLEGIDTMTQQAWVRNYDAPLTARGDPMPPNIQATYTEGDIITIEVLVTTHHKGHFVFSACPIVPLFGDDSATLADVPLPLKIPTQECFDKYKLKFVQDELYGAPPDPQFPERAYIAPASVVEWSQGSGAKEQPVVGAEYKMKFQLPKGLNGELVLIQWYYLTANSCKHEGYAEYNFPTSWGSDVSNYKQLPDCENVPPDGNGVPEQFWNCGEVKIEGKRKAQLPTLIDSDQIQIIPIDIAFDVDEPQPVSFPDNSSVSNDPKPTSSELCSDDTFNYYEANADCTGYIYCISGVPDKEYPCGDGMLYDQAKQMCTWADEVSCGGKALPGDAPSLSTSLPTDKPNPLLVWDPEASKRPHDKTIIGYYASWQWYDRNGLAAPKNLDFSKITRANFAFFQITEDGYIFGTDNWADPITLFGPYDWMAEKGSSPLYCSWDTFDEEPACSAHHYEEGLIYLAHKAGAEVYPSIGGWTLSDPFPAMAANQSARKTFASQCVELIKNYNFDGIDLDWEYPGFADHSGTPDDTVNFNLLLDDLRSALDELEKETGKYYGLTAALPCGPPIIEYQDIAHVSSVLTELNLMTYDLHGTWNDKTGVNAPLYDQMDSPELSVHGCVTNWLEGGAPPNKINIGFPFYGRSFAGAKGLYEPFDGADKATFSEDEGVPQYYNILLELGEMTSVRDNQTATQYAYSDTGFVSYDDPQAICDKTSYGIDNDLNGYIIWELSGDLLEDLSTPLLDAANAKLSNPSLECSSMRDKSSLADSEVGQGQVSNGKPTPTSSLYYPLFDGTSTCSNDGNEPSWILPSELFNNEEDCCAKHFSYNPDCTTTASITPVESNIIAIEETEDTGYYPSPESFTCISDGKQLTYLDEYSVFDSKENCCKHHFGWNPKCVEGTTASTEDIVTITDTTATIGHTIAENSAETTTPPTKPVQSVSITTDATTSSTTTASTIPDRTTDSTSTQMTVPLGNSAVEFASTIEEIPEIPTLAEVFSSSEPQMMTAPIESKDKDQSWATYYFDTPTPGLTEYSSDISNGGNDSSDLHSDQSWKVLSIDEFFVDLLPVNSPHILGRNRKQLSKDASSYLMSFFRSIKDWKYEQNLISFDLKCDTTEEEIGTELKFVLQCDGDFIFDNRSMPRKRELNDLVHSAFAGYHHTDFLDFLYPDHVSEQIEKDNLPKLEIETSNEQQREENGDSSSEKQFKKKNKVKRKKKKLINLKRENENHRSSILPQGNRRMLRATKE